VAGINAPIDTVCPQVCPNCCRTLTIADKATSDALSNMASALHKLIAQNECNENEKSRRDANDEQPGNTLLEAIRLLTTLSPVERAALIGLLNALG